MKRLDLNLATPAEILAADEALLDWCEAGQGEELLLFWEPRETFVVVGYANKVATEVNVTACTQKNVPIFRRCSGGGTVVQLPGGLNYSLILRIEENSPTRSISSSNKFIMDRNCASIAGEFGIRNSEFAISVRGHTDLCLGNLKFAGNSQRRRKNYLLFHGTLLLNCNLNLITELLLMPSLQPDYRASRSHADFLTNLSIPVQTVKTALANAWGADDVVSQIPLESITKLAREKYSTREWNWKF
jgi:lipoate-protein ligase A